MNHRIHEASPSILKNNANEWLIRRTEQIEWNSRVKWILTDRTWKWNWTINGKNSGVTADVTEFTIGWSGEDLATVATEKLNVYGFRFHDSLLSLSELNEKWKEKKYWNILERERREEEACSLGVGMLGLENSGLWFSGVFIGGTRNLSSNFCFYYWFIINYLIKKKKIE